MKRKFLKSALVGLTLCAGITFGMTLKNENKAHAAGYYNININGGRFDGNTYVCNGKVMKNCFFCDGTYTYYLDHNGHPMKDKLTYHPNGKEVIYFDAYGHEVFDNFTHVVKSISGIAVDDYCYFNTYGYMYVDRLTFDRTGTKLYYINPYGQMEHRGLFSFSNGAMGYANYDGNLTRGQFQTILGNMFYFHSSGYSAQGLITDGCWFYNYDKNSRYLGKFVNTTHWVPTVTTPTQQSQTSQQTQTIYMTGTTASSERYREDIDTEIRKFIEAEDRNEGCNNYHFNEHLYKVAKLRAKEASENFDHTSRNGYDSGYKLIEALTMAKSERYSNDSASTIAQKGFQSWMNSTAHKCIVIGNDDFGVAAYEKGGYIYFAFVGGDPDDYIAERYADTWAKQFHSIIDPDGVYQRNYDHAYEGFVSAYGERKVW